MPPPLSIIIPAFNEARRLPATLAALRARIEIAALGAAEVIVVDDGSDDGTAEAARAACPGWAGLCVLVQPSNLGKGAAVRRGMANARGEFAAFVDADLPYDLAALDDALARLRNGADLVIGARDLPDSGEVIGYSPLRRLSGRVYAALVNRLAVRAIPDTQCGFKIFRREVARALFPRVTLDGFAFDVELLALAQRLGLRIERVPVHLTHSDDSRVRLARDSARMLRDLLRVNRRAARGIYSPLDPHGEPVPCPACDGDAPRFERGLRGWLLARCGECGILYLWNRPGEEALAALYGENYFAGGGTEGGYEDYESRRGEQLATANDRLSVLRRLRPQGRLLEVGCGPGHFLAAAKDLYPGSMGIDLSEAAVALARAAGLPARCGTLETLPETEGNFSVLYAADLFEHLARPREFLASAALRIEPCGLIALVTPDEGGWLRRVSGGRWISFKLPEHVAFYRAPRLSALLREAGFTPLFSRPAPQRVAPGFLLARLRAFSPVVAALAAPLLAPWRLAGRAVNAPSGNLLMVARLERPPGIGTAAYNSPPSPSP